MTSEPPPPYNPEMSNRSITSNGASFFPLGFVAPPLLVAALLLFLGAVPLAPLLPGVGSGLSSAGAFRFENGFRVELSPMICARAGRQGTRPSARRRTDDRIRERLLHFSRRSGVGARFYRVLARHPHSNPSCVVRGVRGAVEA